jgi:hypothetical protein
VGGGLLIVLYFPFRQTTPGSAQKKPRRGGTGGDRAWLVGLLRCIDYKRVIVADRFVKLPAQCVADKCAVFGRPPVRRMRYLRACPAVTRFAIVFTGRPLSKNHRCCPDAAGFNAPKSWAGVFHVAKYEKRGLPCSASEQTPRIQPTRPRCLVYISIPS